MAVPFARSTRSLSADNFHFTLIGLVLAGLLLGMWCLWFFLADVKLLASSQEAQMIDGEVVVALFPKEEIHRIARGQRGRYKPDGVALEAGSIICVVSEVTRDDKGQGQVELVVLRERLVEPVSPNTTGRVDIEVGQLSPASLVLQAMGLSGDDKKSPTDSSR